MWAGGGGGGGRGCSPAWQACTGVLDMGAVWVGPRGSGPCVARLPGAAGGPISIWVVASLQAPPSAGAAPACAELLPAAPPVADCRLLSGPPRPGSLWGTLCSSSPWCAAAPTCLTSRQLPCWQGVPPAWASSSPAWWPLMVAALQRWGANSGAGRGGVPTLGLAEVGCRPLGWQAGQREAAWGFQLLAPELCAVPPRAAWSASVQPPG